MTNDELIQHRLQELERFATGGRQVERDVDTLKVTQAAMQQTLTEIQSEVRQMSASVGGLYKRLDEALREQAREEGREQGRAEAQTRTWRVVGFTVMAMIPTCGVVVALLNLVLN